MYGHFLSSIVAFHQRFFKEAFEYSAAYVSALVVVLASFAAIALQIRLERSGFSLGSGTTDWSKAQTWTLMVVLYVGHFFWLAYKGRLRAMFDRYEALSTAKKQAANAATGVVIFGTLAWMVLELLLH